MSEPTPKSFSRRTFLTAGGFFITSMALPIVQGVSGEDVSAPGGLDDALSVFTPTVAYAKDAEATFEISVTTESTIVFKAVDVTQLTADATAENLPAVAGAKITCYDPASKKTYSGTADDLGYFSIDISDGTKRSENSWEPAYSTNLQVSITYPGHHDVTLLSLYVQGATLYFLPCPTTKDEGAYFRAIGFDDLDVQYTKASFLNASTNDAEHTLRAQVWLKDGKPDNVTVHFFRWRSTSDTFPGESSSDVRDLGFISLAGAKPISSDAADANTFEAQLKGRFLMGNSDQAFAEGDRLVVGVLRDGFRYLAVTLAQFKKAPFDDAGTGNLSTLPGVSFSGDNSFKFPDKVPVLGGGTFSMWQPSDLFIFNWSPFGYLKIGMTLGAVGESKDLNSWKFSSVQKGNDQLKALQKQNDEAINKAVALGKQQNAPGAQGLDKYYSSEFTPKFSVSVGMSVYLDAAYEWLESKAWRVSLGGAVALKGEAVFTFQMMIGPVPVFLSLSLGLGLTLAAKVGGVTYWPDGDDAFLAKVEKFLGSMVLDWKNTQCAFTINFDIAMTGGVGVSGVASIGLRYAIGLTIYVSFYEEAKGLGDGSQSYPHQMAFMDLSVSIAIQFFLFKYSKTLWSLEPDERKLYDSWDSKSSAASLDAAVSALADDSVPDEGGDTGHVTRDADGNYRITLETLAKNATEVTADELAALREAGTKTSTTSQVAALDADGDGTKLVSVAHQDDSGLYTIVCGTDAQIAGVRAGLGYEDADADADVVPQDVPAVVDATDAGETGETNADAAAVPVALSDDAAAQADSTAAEEYVYPDTGIAMDEDLYDRSKFVSGDDAISSIADVATSGGVTAKSGKILSNVFSDGRPKFMEIDGVLTMFRIAAVSCNGKMRTRLVVQRKTDGKWSDPNTIDFTPTGINGLSRDDLYDYDFDIASIKCESSFWGGGANNHNDVVILLFSGTRDYDGVANDSVSRLEASSGQHVSTVIDYGYAVDLTSMTAGFRVKSSLSWRTFADAASYGDNQIFAFMPRLNVRAQQMVHSNTEIFDDNRMATVFVTCSYAYKHQDKSSKMSILSDSVPTHVAVAATSFEVAAGMFTDGYLKVTTPLRYVSGGVFDGFDGNITYITNGPTPQATFSTDDGYLWESYFGVQIERKNAQGTDERAFGVMKVAATQTASLLTDQASSKLTYTPSVFYQPDSSLKRLVPWPGHDAMIAMREIKGDDGQKYNVAYSLTFDLDSKGGSFPTGTQIGPSTGLPLDFMITSNGKALLYADNQKNKYVPTQDDKGNPVLDDKGNPVMKQAEGSYRVMAMKAVEDNGKVAFSKPFAACTIDHAIDAVVAVATGNEVTDIIGLEIADISKSLANYWEIAIPCIACATPISITPVGGLVIKGQHCTFEIELRNDGNTILRGTGLHLVDGETQEVLHDNVAVKFDATTVVDSSDSKPASSATSDSEDLMFETGYEALGNHILAKDGGRDVLAPGRFARVRAQIMVPTSWGKKHKIVVKTNKLTYIDPITSEETTTSSLASIDASTGNCSYVAGIAGVGNGAEGVSFGTQGDDACCDVQVSVGSGSAENLGYSEAWETNNGGGDGGDGGNGGNGGGSGSGNGNGNGGSGNGNGGNGSGSGNGGSGSNGKKGTPNTGDSTIGGIAGVAAAAAGAIGMGFMAYSNRRLEVEREEREVLEVDATIIDDED